MQYIDKFNQIITKLSKTVIISHINPDGDAIGSILALKEVLISCGHTVNAIVPNEIPRFLHFADKDKRINVFKEDSIKATAMIDEAELIICVDFNDISTRIGAMGEVVLQSNATKVLIDHHISPMSAQFDIVFSDVNSSSTAYLVYAILEKAGLKDKITKQAAEALYMGIMTDTGNFSFSNLTGDLFRTAGALIDKGVDPVYINAQIYNNQSENRMRLMGYLIGKKMVVMQNKNAAYITLSLSEQQRFNHKSGDTEGIVNIPLSIEGIGLSAIFIETTECVKISLRSTADSKIDVNQLARTVFTGGGHKNAAGAKSFASMDDSVGRFIDAIKKIKD